MKELGFDIKDLNKIYALSIQFLNTSFPTAYPEGTPTGQSTVYSLFQIYILNFNIPFLCKKCLILTFNTPKPYFTLLLKLMDDASSKYLVGQLISAI